MASEFCLIDLWILIRRGQIGKRGHLPLVILSQSRQHISFLRRLSVRGPARRKAYLQTSYSAFQSPPTHMSNHAHTHAHVLIFFIYFDHPCPFNRGIVMRPTSLSAATRQSDTIKQASYPSILSRPVGPSARPCETHLSNLCLMNRDGGSGIPPRSQLLQITP